jgi:hypothetical protein
VRVRPGLSPSGDAGDDQVRVTGEQDVGRQSKPFQGARGEVFGQHVRPLGEVEQERPTARVLQVKGDAALAARVGLPVGVVAVDQRGAQLVAHPRLFNFDHVGAQVGQDRGEVAARDQPRQIEHPNAIERSGGARLVLLPRSGHQPHPRRPTQSARRASSGPTIDTVVSIRYSVYDGCGAATLGEPARLLNGITVVAGRV